MANATGMSCFVLTLSSSSGIFSFVHGSQQLAMF